MLQRFKKIKWKRGSGEIIGFGLCIPMIILLICAILSAGFVSSSNQKLTYTAYCVSRAACVSTNQDRAQDRAEAVLKDMYGDLCDGVKFVSLTESVSVPNLQPNHVYLVCRVLGPTWKKGTMLRCSVYQYLNPIMPFSASMHVQTVTMMLENAPADLLDDFD